MVSQVDWYRSEPPDRSGVVARFRSRLRRLFGHNYRLVWYPQAGRVSPPGRWTIEERGHRTGRWQYVWQLQSEQGVYREVGDWAFQRLHQMDMAVACSGLKGWEKIKGWRDGQRKERAKNKIVELYERFNDEVMPRRMRELTMQGHCVRPHQLSPEQSILTSPMGNPFGTQERERLEVANLALQHAPMINVSGRAVFDGLGSPPKAQHQKNKRRRGRRG